MRPKVLVLLAAFNGADWIVEQIESILNQVDVELDLLVGDDGSTDDTLAKLRQFADDQRVRVISSPTPTGSAAQNFLQLMRNAPAEGSEYVALADQDDIWQPEKLIRGCTTLAKQGAAGYSCAVTAFWDDGKEKILRQVNSATPSDFLFEGAGQGCTFVITRQFFHRLRTFLAQHAAQTASLHFHDWAIYALSRSWGLSWTFDQKSLVRYRQHARNDTGARSSTAGITRRLYLIKNGWYRTQLVTIAQLCHVAAPENRTIAEWRRLLAMPGGAARVISILRFCLNGGRRRRVDNAVLMAAAIAGWL